MKRRETSNHAARGTTQSHSHVALPWDSFLAAAELRDYATDHTHALYRYPARMSPPLARSLILGLTSPGDLVVDPFIGGGTTAIEALSNGRRIFGSDLNSLACFVSLAKAWPATTRSLKAYAEWGAFAMSDLLRRRRGATPLVTQSGAEYAPRTHGLVRYLRTAAERVKEPGARRLALLTVLRVAQLCFDCRRLPPTPSVLSERFQETSGLVLDKMKAYAAACREHHWPGGLGRSVRVIQADAQQLSKRLPRRLDPVRLILTSPPYPGVHVLYHRWQVYGRKETSLPYELLGLMDGSFESHYTFGSRKKADEVYFDKLTAVYCSLRPLTTTSTIVAQVVGFSDPARQLLRFRAAMQAAGFEELSNPESPDDVIARLIPNRRWYAELPASRGTGHEFVLLHRPCSTGAENGATKLPVKAPEPVRE
jgi:DNA methylase